MRSRLNIKLWPTLGVLILGLAPGALAQSSNMGCGYNSSSKPSATLKPASLVLVSKNDWVGRSQVSGRFRPHYLTAQ